jgi:hypothetical protein
VLIPQNLVVPEGSHAKDPAAPALTDGALRFKGRHAALAAETAGNGGGSPAPEPSSAPAWAADTALRDTALRDTAPRDPADTADLGAMSLGSPASRGFAEPGLSLGGTGYGGPLGAGGDPLGAGGDPLGAGGRRGGFATGPDADFGEAGLPRRVRQASLAPRGPVDALPGGDPLHHDGHPAGLGTRPIRL